MGRTPDVETKDTGNRIVVNDFIYCHPGVFDHLEGFEEMQKQGLINEYHALALKLATKAEIERIKELAFKTNEVMKKFFKERKVDLVDFKLEFGRLSDGTIVLADEISPDTCRFWDSETHDKLDKDRFRRDLGNVEDAYKEMLKRIIGIEA